MDINATYIGHATLMIELGKSLFLTDPHFGKRVLLSRRHTPLPVQPWDLPEPTAILLSHMHPDHFDANSFRFLFCRTPVICPPKASSYLKNYISNPLIEIDYYANYLLPSGEEIIAIPVRHHGSFCRPFTCNKASSYVVRSKDGSFYFCADSGYGPHFSEVGSVYSPDVSFLPIGGYLPKFLQRWHMDPPTALRAFKDLKSNHMVCIHHSTFRLSLERTEEPRRWMEALLAERPELKKRVHNSEPNGRITFA